MTTKSLLHSSLLDNQYYTSMLVGNDAYIPITSDYYLLQTETLDGSQATVSFSSLVSSYSADYQHLQIRAVIRSNRGLGGDAAFLQINNQTGAAYSYHGIRNAASYNTGTSDTKIYLTDFPDGQSGPDRFGSFVLDILDPFDASKNTTTRCFSGSEATKVQVFSGLYQLTAAVDELDFFCLASYDTHSRFSLYGLKKEVS